MREIVIATEDVLSESVARRLVAESSSRLIVGQALRRNGAGYLRSRFRNFCEIARRTPVLLIADLDTATCPPDLLHAWSRRDAIPGQLLFRIAVRQIESWILADREGIAKFLSVGVAKIPKAPDTLGNAKHTLLRVAQAAPRRIRGELVAERNAIASQGLGYNDVLSKFIRNAWNPKNAASRSGSLNRARKRLSELARGS